MVNCRRRCFAIRGQALVSCLPTYPLKKPSNVTTGYTEFKQSLFESQILSDIFEDPTHLRDVTPFIRIRHAMSCQRGEKKVKYEYDVQLYIALKSSDTASGIERLESCLTSLHCWLCHNGLCLNPDKSEAIIFGTHQRLRTFPVISSVNVAGTPIKLSSEITSLGVVMDPKLTFEKHVSSICKN